jgi:hypothetical protein
MTTATRLNAGPRHLAFRRLSARGDPKPSAPMSGAATSFYGYGNSHTLSLRQDLTLTNPVVNVNPQRQQELGTLPTAYAHTFAA